MEEPQMQSWHGVVVVDANDDDPFREIAYCQPAYGPNDDRRVALEFRAQQESRDGRMREIVRYETWFDGDEEVVGQSEVIARFLAGDRLRD